MFHSTNQKTTDSLFLLVCCWVETDLVLVVPVVALTERSSNLLGVPMVKVFFEQLLGSLLKVFLVHLWGRGGYHIGLLCVCVCVCV